MNKFFLAIFVVTIALGTLIYSAVNSTAKAVVTVEELLTENKKRKRIRLGARVADDKIEYVAKPKRKLRFNVKDIGESKNQIPVVFEGTMPDTLKVDRDVILEGDFDGTEFVASELMTQCPSKYEPPNPTSETGTKYE